MLAEVELYSGNFEEPEKCYLLTLHPYWAVNDKEKVVVELDFLSQVYQRQQNWGPAEDTQKTESDACIKYYGHTHPRTMATIWIYVLTLLQIQKIEGASQRASLPLELMSQVYGSSSDTHTRYSSWFDNLFECASMPESLRQLVPSQEDVDAAQLITQEQTHHREPSRMSYSIAKANSYGSAASKGGSRYQSQLETFPKCLRLPLGSSWKILMELGFSCHAIWGWFLWCTTWNAYEWPNLSPKPLKTAPFPISPKI